MVIGDTVTLSAVTAPKGVTLLDDPDETVIATLVPPTLDIDAEEEAIEEETELVGEGAGEERGRRGRRAATRRPTRATRRPSSAPPMRRLLGGGSARPAPSTG